jgi:hypothetical protein
MIEEEEEVDPKMRVDKLSELERAVLDEIR